MAKLIERRVTAEIDGDFVVFLIGTRLNRVWKPWKWLPVFAASRAGVRDEAYPAEAGTERIEV